MNFFMAKPLYSVEDHLTHWARNFIPRSKEVRHYGGGS
jgi:hypothetical protein